MTKKTAPKLTTCPSAAYQEYKPDLATRLAIERARREQPPLLTLASAVPSLVKGEGWR